MMIKQIQYSIDANGLVWSRVGSEMAIPVLDYENMTPENNFQMNYRLEKFDVLDVCHELRFLKPTRNIPPQIKELHRKFWGC